MWPFSKSQRKNTSTEKIDRKRPLCEETVERQQASATTQAKAAQALGRHYIEWLEPVRELKRQHKLDEAERILPACVDATERESEIAELGVAPWYYEQPAIIYRQQDRIDD